MRYKPYFNLVIVRVQQKEQVTPGGIVLPATAEVPFEIGQVMDVGPGMHQNGVFVPVQVKVGAQVMVPKHCVKLYISADLIMLKETDLFGELSE